MGTFLSPNQRLPYVPPLDRSGDSSGGTSSDAGTLLGGTPPAANDWISALAGKPQPTIGRDPNIVLANDPGENVQVGQQPAPQPPRRGVAPLPEPDPESPEFQAGMDKAVGRPVTLPNGSRIEDPNSDSGFLMSPVPDLRPVAAAGRRVRSEFENMTKDPEMAQHAFNYLAPAIGKHVGQGGLFDYQRDGNHGTGWTQYPHFRDVSNFNVGLFCQQAGLSLEDALTMAGTLSYVFGRTDRSQPYWVKARTTEFIRKGYAAGKSGMFDEPR